MDLYDAKISSAAVLRMGPRGQEWSRGSCWEGVAKIPLRTEKSGWAGGILRANRGQGSVTPQVRPGKALRMFE